MIWQKGQQTLNMRNEFYDEQMNRVSIATVQQINDRAYYQRDNRWIDSRIVETESAAKPDKIVEFASDEFFEIVEKLAGENRQGSIAIGGEVLLLIDGRRILIKAPAGENN